jgi:nitrogen fixation NifU-like protein
MSDPLAGLYQEVILDHSKRRIGFGEIVNADAEKFERNPTCGDEITLQLRLEEGSERVAEVVWRGAGCSISMASASVLAELAPGMTLDELSRTVDEFRQMLRSRGVGEPDIDILGDAVAFQGVSKFVMRVKCAMLSWVALEACIAQVRSTRP